MISIKGLTKRFGGLTAVDNLSLEIPAGMIVGLLGPNGAGKTTTLKMVTGMLKPDAGTALINGVDIVTHPVEAKRLLGFVPDSAAVYESLTGLEFLLMIGSLYGLSEEKAVPRIWQFLHLFDIDEDSLTKKLLGTYSKGTRRKIVIIAALLHNPDVVLLDEPLDGLDPIAALGFKALLEGLAQEGKTIVYSSHILDVVERVCDRVAIMGAGQILMEGTPAELLAANEMDNLESLFTSLAGGSSVTTRAQVYARSMSS